MDIVKEIFFGCLGVVISMAKVIIPIMVLIELLTVFKVMEKITNFLKPAASFLGISKNAVFPMVVGILAGVTFGAGTLLDAAREYKLPKRDIFLLGVFFASFHGAIETTFIFAAVGANVWLIFFPRLIFAFVSIIIASRIIKNNKNFDKIPLE